VSEANKNEPRWPFGPLTGITIILSYTWMTSRGVLSGENTGNIDVNGHLANATYLTSKPSIFGGYDFTLGLGQRVFGRSLWLNPFSIVKYWLGPINGPPISRLLWLGVYSVAMMLVTRRLRSNQIVTLVSTTFVAMWMLAPSPLLATKLVAFGGHSMEFVSITSFIVVCLLWTSGVDAERVSPKLILLLMGIWSLLGSGFSQAVVIWVLALVVLVTTLVEPRQTALTQRALNLTTLILTVAVSLAVVIAISPSPIITVLAGSRSIDSSFWGIGSAKAQVWVAWYSLGSTTPVRLLILTLLVVGFTFSRNTLGSPERAWVMRTFSLLISVQIYSFLFYVLLEVAEFEIGPTPAYLAELLVMPLLGVFVGITYVGCLRNLQESFARRLPSLNAWSMRLMLVLIVLLAAQWVVRNPESASRAFARTDEINLHSSMSDNEVLAPLSSARVLFISPGKVYPDTGLFIWDDFLAGNLYKQRNDSVILYGEYGYGISQWQYWLFNEFGSLGGQNSGTLMWSRDFDPNFARLLQVTHVWASQPIDSPLLRLLRFKGGLHGYLYEMRPIVEPSKSMDFQTVVAREIETATRLAFELAGDGTKKIVTNEPLGSPQHAVGFRYSIEETRITFSAGSRSSSVVHFPIEFSKCHSLRLSRGNETVARLIPVNGRFLGLHFTGQIEGQINFDAVGPAGLLCQLQDLWDTRLLRQYLRR